MSNPLAPTPEDRARALLDSWDTKWDDESALVALVAAALRSAEREAVEGCAKLLDEGARMHRESVREYVALATPHDYYRADVLEDAAKVLRARLTASLGEGAPRE